MVRFSQQQGGWLTLEDLAEFHVAVEAPVKTTYRGYEVYACGPWCQGPVVLQTLNILEGYDRAGRDRFDAEVYHLILEALKAAFADRDRYYGDPRFVDVPIDGLLSKAYAKHWQERIDLCVATPSDGVTGSPLVEGLGFIISSRGMQSWLDPDHPSCLAPGKRPRLTPAPGLVLKDGRLVMPYGTPGNDMQPQAMVQFLVNVIDYQMNPQQAMDAPRCATFSFPRSSDPHPYTPGLCHLEARVDPSVPEALLQMGHKLRMWPEWTKAAGSLGAIQVDREHGALHGTADLRRVAYAI